METGDRAAIVARSSVFTPGSSTPLARGNGRTRSRLRATSIRRGTAKWRVPQACRQIVSPAGPGRATFDACCLRSSQPVAPLLWQARARLLPPGVWPAGIV